MNRPDDISHHRSKAVAESKRFLRPRSGSGMRPYTRNHAEER
jgi:hypothetical protein